jgi:hypothetical protein
LAARARNAGTIFPEVTGAAALADAVVVLVEDFLVIDFFVMAILKTLKSKF